MAKELILVADDDRVIVELLTQGLRGHGYQVTAAVDAIQVMMSVRRTPPALILLDIMMPGGTGLEVLRRIRSNTTLGLIPVIAITASTDPELPKKAQELGASAFLHKPIQMDELVGTIRRLLHDPAGPPSPQV